MKSKLLFLIIAAFTAQFCFSQNSDSLASREHLLMDFNWRFALGHPYDTKKDYNNGTGYFSYFAKQAMVMARQHPDLMTEHGVK